MTFTVYWQSKLARNPALNTPDFSSVRVSLTAESLKKELQKAYDIGYTAGKEVGHRVQKTRPYDTLFGGMFGG